MKTIKCLAILLMLATSAQAGGKRKVQFDVCTIDGGKLSVVHVSPKQAEALTVAQYLEIVTQGKRHYFVVVELTETGDVK